MTQFEAERERLHGVAYRMLGSATDADDAVQEAWLRLRCKASDPIQNVPGWLTTVISRIALDMIRTRRLRKEEYFDETLSRQHAATPCGSDPEQQALLAEAIGIGLLMVMNRLQPSERLSFVSHDIFGVPFQEIAPILGHSASNTRQLASRARCKLRETNVVDGLHNIPHSGLVAAFFTAARGGDFGALLKMLGSDISLYDCE